MIWIIWVSSNNSTTHPLQAHHVCLFTNGKSNSPCSRSWQCSSPNLGLQTRRAQKMCFLQTLFHIQPTPYHFVLCIFNDKSLVSHGAKHILVWSVGIIPHTSTKRCLFHIPLKKETGLLGAHVRPLALAGLPAVPQIVAQTGALRPRPFDSRRSGRGACVPEFRAGSPIYPLQKPRASVPQTTNPNRLFPGYPEVFNSFHDLPGRRPLALRPKWKDLHGLRSSPKIGVRISRNPQPRGPS